MTQNARTETASLNPAEDKSLVAAAGEDKSEDPETVKAAAIRAEARGEGQEKIRVVYVHHRGDYKPGDTVSLPADEANRAIAAQVAKLAD